MRRRSVAAAVALAVIVGIATFASQLASDAPDGLERVAEDEGFAGAAGGHALGRSPVAGYEVDGVADGRVAGGLAGLLGVALTLAVAVVALRVIRRGRDREPAAGAGAARDG